LSQCVFCNHRLVADKTEIRTTYEDLTVEIQDVPCQRCIFCGRITFPAEASSTIERFVDGIKPNRINGTIWNYYNNLLETV